MKSYKAVEGFICSIKCPKEEATCCSLCLRYCECPERCTEIINNCSYSKKVKFYIKEKK